jgi:hypothetical protein
MNPQKDKVGRPRKNFYDSLRLARVYKHIHSYTNVTDYELAKRMQIVLKKLFKKNVSTASMRGWISQIKRGKKASISPENLWSLIYSIAPNFYQNIKWLQSLDKSLTYEICTFLHYSVNGDFLSLDRAIEKKGGAIFIKRHLLQRKGPEIFSIFFDCPKKWIYPQVNVLDSHDLAVDTAEVLKKLLNINIHLGLAKKLANKIFSLFKTGITTESYKKAKKEIYLNLIKNNISDIIIDDESVSHQILQMFVIKSTQRLSDRQLIIL